MKGLHHDRPHSTVESSAKVPSVNELLRSVDIAVPRITEARRGGHVSPPARNPGIIERTINRVPPKMEALARTAVKTLATPFKLLALAVAGYGVWALSVFFAANPAISLVVATGVIGIGLLTFVVSRCMAVGARIESYYETAKYETKRRRRGY